MAVDASPTTFDIDPELGLCACFVSAPRRHLIYIKVLLESYEGVGVARSEDPFYDDERALLVLLLVPDFLDAAAGLIGHFETAVGLRRESVEPSRLDRLRADLLGELERD